MIYKELVPNPKDRIMCVKVGKVKRENLYEMTAYSGGYPFSISGDIRSVPS